MLGTVFIALGIAVGTTVNWWISTLFFVAAIAFFMAAMRNRPGLPGHDHADRAE